MLPNTRAPAQRTAPPRDLEIRPKQVKAWIEALPHAQGAEAAKKMTAHLAALNRAKFDVDDRVQILETYLPFVATVLEELDASYGKAALPLSTRAREALNQARGLAFELASGYRIAIMDKSGKLIAFGAKKQLPLLACRAMQFLVAELRASYKAYSPVPPQIWREIHHLFLYADKEGFAADPADPETKATVMDIYCEALLLALTDPYRLVPGEIDRIVAQIRAMRGLVTLGQARPGTRSGGHFLVPCDTDKPPKPALSASDDTGGPNWRLLDANPVVDKLRARKQAIDSGNVSATMSRSVSPDVLAQMGKLITLWGDPPKRAYRRDEMDTSVAICVGLKSVSHFISHEREPEAAAEGETIRSGITVPLIAVPNDEVSKSFPVFEWDVVNQSEGGVKVRRVEPTLQPIAVGEVVGIMFLGRTRWTIGVTRWITQLDEGGMEFGVQFLAPAARTVWVQPSMSASPQAKLGLVLDDEEAEEASLLTLPNLYEDLRVLELDEQGSTWTVRATSLIERTARFDLFHVSAS
jgi:cyclic-di-GMP-binding protein